MSDQSQDIINEYKDQIRILKQEVAELQDAGKSKDAANKRCLQKLEYANTDLEKSNNKVKELEKKLKEEKATAKMMYEHP
jgi:chromosome segregation ATPase